MNLGEKILKLRKKQNMSQEDLANILNVSRQTISKWETGESTPEIDKVVLICDYFKISTDDLLKERDIRYEKEIGKLKGKNKALSISLCIIIFTFMCIAVIFLDEICASDFLIATISLIGLASIAIILVNLFIEEPINKPEKSKKEKIIHSIWFLSILFIYFIISILCSNWDYSWIIFLIGLLLYRLVELIRILGGKNEK